MITFINKHPKLMDWFIDSVQSAVAGTAGAFLIVLLKINNPFLMFLIVLGVVFYGYGIMSLSDWLQEHRSINEQN